MASSSFHGEEEADEEEEADDKSVDDDIDIEDDDAEHREEEEGEIIAAGLWWVFPWCVLFLARVVVAVVVVVVPFNSDGNEDGEITFMCCGCCGCCVCCCVCCCCCVCWCCCCTVGAWYARAWVEFAMVYLSPSFPLSRFLSFFTICLSFSLSRSKQWRRERLPILSPAILPLWLWMVRWVGDCVCIDLWTMCYYHDGIVIN